MEEGQGVEPCQLVFETSLYPTECPPEIGGDGEIRTLVARWPRHVSSVLGSPLALSSPWSRPQVLPLDLGADLAQRGISPLEALASRPGWWPTRDSNPEGPA